MIILYFILFESIEKFSNPRHYLHSSSKKIQRFQWRYSIFIYHYWWDKRMRNWVYQQRVYYISRSYAIFHLMKEIWFKWLYLIDFEGFDQCKDFCLDLKSFAQWNDYIISSNHSIIILKIHILIKTYSIIICDT